MRPYKMSNTLQQPLLNKPDLEQSDTVQSEKRTLDPAIGQNLDISEIKALLKDDIPHKVLSGHSSGISA
jgi:hypothetical protein